MKTTANFEIYYHQILNAEGKLIQDLPVFAKDTTHLLKLYRLMTQLRVFDAKAITLQRTGKLGTYPSTLGQEAVSVGVGNAMEYSDVFLPDYRQHGAMLQRGVKMSDILTFWGGDERGSDFAHPEDFPVCIPIANQCLHATGVAYAFKYRKEPRVSVSIIGDGGTSEGDFYEALNLAGEWMLPTIFVVNNNQWAISVPRSAQTKASTLAQKAIAAGIEGVQVDGNDVIAVRHVMDYALNKARKGEGPTVIEAITYRLCDHTTADDAKRYRGISEVEQAWQEEPLLRLRHYLQSQNLWSAEEEAQLLANCATEVEAAVQEYLTKPPQPVESIIDFHYATLPKALEEQRACLLEETNHA